MTPINKKQEVKRRSPCSLPLDSTATRGSLFHYCRAGKKNFVGVFIVRCYVIDARLWFRPHDDQLAVGYSHSDNLRDEEIQMKKFRGVLAIFKYLSSRSNRASTMSLLALGGDIFKSEHKASILDHWCLEHLLYGFRRSLKNTTSRDSGWALNIHNLCNWRYNFCKCTYSFSSQNCFFNSIIYV